MTSVVTFIAVVAGSFVVHGLMSPSGVDGLCYAIDSQIVLIITTIGSDVSVAQQIRPLVEVTGS